MQEQGRDEYLNNEKSEEDRVEKRKLEDLFECEVVETAFTCHEPRSVH